MAQEDLILLEEAPKKETELEIVPDFDAARPDTSRRLEPSTTDYTAPDLAPHLELVPIPGEERSESDDDLFRRIEGEITYRPTDAELDKFLKYKSRQPKYAIDLIKGAWHGGKAVVTDLAKGVWGAIKDPELAFSPVPKGQARRVTTLAEGAARATWDLGTVGRYINDWFGEQRDLEYQEEIDDMKLRQSNPDWQSKTRRWKASTKEQKEAMRKSWSTFYIKKRIKEDLEDLEGTTNNFKDPKADLKRDFGRMGLVFVDGEDKGFYTSSKYINEVLPAKQREKYYKEFPKWINKRQRDRWRRGRYLMRTTELARRGEQTILGELFGPKVDEAAKALVNSDVATLASYAGGPGEVGAVLSTKLARKAATKSGRAVGRTTELAGKGTKWAGEKVQQIGEWATSSPEKSAALGAALGAAAGQDIPTIAKGIFGGLVEQKVRTIPTAGRVLQKAGTAIEAVGEVLTKPEGVEGLLKASSRVAKDESVADAFNRLSWLDPAINFAGDLGKGTATGGAFGLALTLPSGDPEVIGSGLGAGATGGFFATIPGRYLTRGAKLKEQLRNEWGQFQKELTPEQLNNIKEYAPTLEEMGNVMATVKMLNGVTRGGGNMDFKFLSPTDFIKAHGVQRGVVVTKTKTRPSVEINVGFKGPNALFHEGWHALKRFAGETELQKTPEGKKEVEVLKPYLDQIQTILFGKRLGGKTVTEGMFSEKDLVGGFYDQYTSKMAPEELTTFERQFKYDESGKELTPAEAKQRKLNYMMEEVEAESFRYLMSNADPRQIAQGDRSLHQRFTDHMLLSEHSKTLRGMRKALEVVGVNFKPTGQPSDIFVQKGQGITNTRELNAALRQYMKAWEGMQYRTRMMGELEPSGFSIGGTGKTGRAQVEFHLGKKENQFLRDHFSSSDMLKKNKDGGVYYDPDGRVVLLTEGEIRKLRENRGELIREKLSETDDGTGMILKENGSFEGIPSPHQLDAIDRISDEIVTPNQKRIIRETADIMRNDPGAPIQFLYNAALGRGKTYSSSLSSTHRTAVPIGFHVSQAQNFYFTALDLGAYHRKISAWGDPTKKALHKGGHKLALWDKDVRAFEADLFKYLENHKYDRPGDTGLDPNPQKAEQKRNALNDFFNINKGDETVTEGNFNPVTAARRAIDPKTGRQKKRAYRGLENLLRSYRLDRVLDENFGKSMSYALGRAVPMKSGADFFQKQLKNLMPAPGEGAEIKRTDPDIDIFDNSVRSQLPSFDKSKNHPNFLKFFEQYGGFDRRFHLNLLADRVLNDFFRNKSDLEVHRRVVEREGSEEAAQSLYEERMQFGSTGYDQVARNKGLMYPEIKSLFADFFASLPADMKGIDARTGETVNPVQPSLDFFGKGEVRPLDDILGDISNLLTSVDPNRSKGVDRLGLSRDILGLADIAREAGADISQGAIDKIFKKVEGMTEAEVKAANAKVMAKMPEFFDKQQAQGGLDVYKKIDPDDTSRFMPAPTFYSKAERAVEASQQKTMSVDQAVSLATKGIPKAEYEWSGVVDWLEGRKEDGAVIAKESKEIIQKMKSSIEGEPIGYKRGSEMHKKDIAETKESIAFWEKALIEAEAKAAGKVSKAELLEFLQNKGVKVEEVARGKAPVTLEKLPDSQNPDGVKSVYSIYRADDPSGAFYGSVGQIVERSPGKLKGAISEIQGDGRFEVNVPEVNTARFKTLEEAKDYVKNQSGLGYNTLFKPGESDWVMLPGDEKAQQSYGELVLTLPKERGKSHETFDLPSGHRFPEENILAHIRFTERVDADGKKMLFIEELQSDWSNTGRRSGWRQERPAKVQKEIVKLQDEKSRLVQETGAFNHPKVEAIDAQIRNLEFKYPSEPAGAPDMPFKGDNRYGALALKRMIRWASDNGFDRLGWITGKDTAERYNLSKVIDEIAVPSVDANSRSVRLDTGEGDSFKLMVDNEGKVDGVLKASQFTGKQLDEVIGKELAKKVMDFKAPGKLAGADLEVGGEWATTLYDKVLPTQAKKIVKKKGAVGRTRLGEDAGGKKSNQLDQSIKQIEEEIRQGTEILESVQESEEHPGWLTLGETGGDSPFYTENNIRDLPREILARKNKLKELRAQKEELKTPEANYVDITPEVKALAEEGFSYFMPPGGGKGRAAAPAQPAPTLPATPIMPKVKLTEEEKEDSRRLLNLLKEKGI